MAKTEKDNGHPWRAPDVGAMQAERNSLPLTESTIAVVNAPRAALSYQPLLTTSKIKQKRSRGERNQNLTKINWALQTLKNGCPCTKSVPQCPPYVPTSDETTLLCQCDGVDKFR